MAFLHDGAFEAPAQRFTLDNVRNLYEVCYLPGIDVLADSLDRVVEFPREVRWLTVDDAVVYAGRITIRCGTLRFDESAASMVVARNRAEAVDSQ